MKADKTILFAHLKSILEDLSRQWKRIVLLVFLSLFLSYTVLSFMSPLQYAVKATIGVNNAGMKAKGSAISEQELYDNYRSAVENASRMKNVLDSKAFQSAVAAELKLEKFEGTVSAARKGDSNLLEIVVRAKDAELAYREAEMIVAKSGDFSTHLAYGLETCVLKIPEFPKHFEEPLRNVKNAFIFGMAVLLLLITCIVISSCIRDTVRCPADVGLKTGLRILATIGHAGKPAFTRSIQRLVRRVIHVMNEEGHQVLMFAGAYEKEGRSTISSYAALCMAHAGEEVILVDLNYYNPSLRRILEEKVSLREGAFREEETEQGKNSEKSDIKTDKRTPGGINDKIASAAKTADMNIYCADSLPLRLLSPCIDPLQKPQPLNSSHLQFGAVAALLQTLRGEGAIIILDTPPSAIISETEEIADNADASVIVIRRHWSDARSINDANDIVIQNTRVLGSVFLDIAGSDRRRDHDGKAI